MIFHLLPIERIQNIRGPRYLARRDTAGLKHKWAMMDFGHTSEIALVATDGVLRAPDVLRLPRTWSRTDRDRVGGYLRSAGIESRWVEQARDWREAWHRLTGLTQVYQSAQDDPDTTIYSQDPSMWMGRDIHFSFETLTALDKELQAAEREAALPRIGEWVLRGRHWMSELTGRVIPLFAGGALPATDAFTNTNGTLLSAHGSWSLVSAAGKTSEIQGNAYTVTSGLAFGDFSCYRWNADTFNNDQYSKSTLTALDGNSTVGVTARCASGANSYYWLLSDTGGTYKGKLVSGTSTDTASYSAPSVNDVVEIRISGTTFGAYKNTVLSGNDTDSSLSSGSAGVVTQWWAGQTTRGDSWEGGNLTSAAGAMLFDDRRRRFQSLLVR